MGTINLYATKYAYTQNAVSGNTHNKTSQPVEIYEASADPHFLLQFESLPDELRYRPIKSIQLHFYLTVKGKASIPHLHSSLEEFDLNSVSYTNLPASDGHTAQINMSLGDNAYTAEQSVWCASPLFNTGSVYLLRAKSFWASGMWGVHTSQTVAGNVTIVKSTLAIATPLSSNKPYLTVAYGDGNVQISAKGLSPIGGYVNPYIEQSFLWQVVPDISGGYSVESVDQKDAILFWRVVGASEWEQKYVDSSQKTATFPSNTFPGASEIEWYVRAYSVDGESFADSPVYTFSTADSLATATPLSPVSSVEDGGAPISFTWAESNDSGSAPTGADVEYSTEEGVSWTSLTHIDGSETSYTVPGGFFSAGEIYWRVRAYNIDGVAGAWTSTFFICVAAPDAPFVSTDAAPFATITWQSSGQLASRVTVDGVDYGVQFGAGKQFVMKTPLADGIHTVSVYVQGQYGLWSQPGTISFNVQNQQGDPVYLDGLFDVDATLFWNTTSLTADYLIFRDGALIGHTTENSFTDRFVLGAHSYYVVNRLSDGNYTKSNTVEGTMQVEQPQIALFAGGDWLTLKYSERSMAEQRFSWSKTHSLRHVAGARFPVLEMSPFEDESGSYDAAFLDADAATAFEAFRGRVVILKSREGKVLIGAVTSLSETVNTFYLSYTFTLQKIHWEDFVDD